MKNLMLMSLVLVSVSLKAAELSLHSEETQTQLIELYTSEGCSSCPPADRWLSSLKSHSGLFKDFIPVAFHVGYWDYIGWKDELVIKGNETRQRLHNKKDNLSAVYTPAVVNAGKEWRRWHIKQPQTSTKQVGKLILKLKDQNLTAIFKGKKDRLILNVALMGMNIETQVKAGENHGKTLKHDFVALKHLTFLSGSNSWDVILSQEFLQSKHNNMALVAWVEAQNNPTPIQAVGTLL